MSTRKAWQRFEVSFTGAFFTGSPLQVRISDYSRVQEQIAKELSRTGAGWNHSGIRWKNVETYGSGGGYTTRVPLVLVRREGTPLFKRLAELERTRPDTEHEWLHRALTGWQWRLRALQVEIYDLGVGVISGTYDVSAPIWLRIKEIQHVAESVARLMHPMTGNRSPVAVSYDLLARETAAIFADALDKCDGIVRETPWLDPMLDALAVDESGDETWGQPQPANEWGRLLSLHPVFILSAGRSASQRRMERLSRPFNATFSTSVKYWHGIFTPGIDTSVVVIRGGREEKEKGPPLKLTLLMWAYYTLFMEMDRGLLAMLDSDKWRKPGPLAELEADTNRIFEVFMRVREARSRLDSALTDLAGGQLSMWRAISDVQKFEELVEAVEGKVATLRYVAERRLQEATTTRARRTSRVLSALTALTVVTVAVALLGNFFGTRSDTVGHLSVRVAVVLVAFLFALIVYREAQRELARKRLGRKRIRMSAENEREPWQQAASKQLDVPSPAEPRDPNHRASAGERRERLVRSRLRTLGNGPKKQRPDTA